MSDHRSEQVSATKYTNAMSGTYPNAAGNHRKSMMQAVDQFRGDPKHITPTPMRQIMGE
jgi:hypothetical protein